MYVHSYVPIALFIEESEPVILFPNPSRQSHTKKPSAHPYQPTSLDAPKHRSHSRAKKRTAHEYYPPRCPSSVVPYFIPTLSLQHMLYAS